jgi:TDG/mug DNA glycosylase family protein
LRPDHAVAPPRQGPDGGAPRALRRLIATVAAPGKRSFPPFADGGSRVLVLGTLPGEESLRRQEYYAHPRNLFWPIVCALFGAAVPARYDDRVRFLRDHGIAVWDVCAEAERRMSADVAIRGEVPNAIDELLAAHPLIRAVAFNGGTARRLYDRHFTRRPELTYLALPSTSPAHASLGFDAKLARWKALREALATL